MSTFINQSKTSTSTPTNMNKSGGSSIAVGTPMGLLLVLTYASTSGGSITFTNLAKS